jgi:nucleotide-binding universal stress UspA family protein
MGEAGKRPCPGDSEDFPMLPIKTILHPTDFSKPSEYALRFACALARDYQARLVLLHVVEPPVYYGELGMAVPLPADFHETLHSKLSHLAPADCGVPVETLLMEGNAAREILRVAEEQHISLIVLGTHGRTGFSRVLLGSVAEDVIRHSRVPVLTLKTPMLLSMEASDSEPTEAGTHAAAAEKPSRSVHVL